MQDLGKIKLVSVGVFRYRINSET